LIQRTWSYGGVACALLLAACALAAAPPDSGKTFNPDKPPKVKTVTVLMGHRIYPDFRDVQTAPLGKDFQVGETDYTARVVEFVPDFAIDGRTHKVVSRSNVPRNPACRIIVREKGVPKDTSWAFVNFPPHFSRRALISFRVVRVEFFDAPTISVEPDTTAAADSTTPGKPR
jgi:hypothetical protein